MEQRITGQLKGIYRDILQDGNGAIIHDSGWTANTIVERCRILLAGFIRNDPSDGIRYMAFGQGLAAWDDGGPPPPDPMAVALVTPYTPPIAFANLSVAYLDEGLSEVAAPTSRLQITAILEPGYPAPLPTLATYPLREFGLFGRLGGTDFMINSIRHAVIHKDASATLIRMIRLFF
ncbi:MAG: hypothetical protein BM485_14705 [Desulfobulbaceae bacterium DB1]|nr:MAG: hypothetical protein BM485_14705 [Desulfobulbaceae bacterium DB1]